MNASAAKFLILSGLLAFTVISFPKTLRAQAPPGPINPAPSTDDSQETATPKPQTQQPQTPATRANLNGSWKLNSDESDDGRQKMQQAKSARNNGNGGGNGGGGRSSGGVGFPGGGIGFPGGGG
ncbi:MAG: hypothetical protein WA766_01460, partial [Candidatus Acidiferrales bacterium]